MVNFPHLVVGHVVEQGHFLLQTVGFDLFPQGVAQRAVANDDKFEGLFAPDGQKQVDEFQWTLFRRETGHIAKHNIVWGKAVFLAQGQPVRCAEVLVQHSGVQTHRRHRDIPHAQRFQLSFGGTGLGQHGVMQIDAQSACRKQGIHYAAFQPSAKAVGCADVGHKDRTVPAAPAVNMRQKELLVAKAEQRSGLRVQLVRRHPTVSTQMPHGQIPHGQAAGRMHLFLFFSGVDALINGHLVAHRGQRTTKAHLLTVVVATSAKAVDHRAQNAHLHFSALLYFHAIRKICRSSTK